MPTPLLMPVLLPIVPFSAWLSSYASFKTQQNASLVKPYQTTTNFQSHIVPCHLAPHSCTVLLILHLLVYTLARLTLKADNGFLVQDVFDDLKKNSTLNILPLQSRNGSLNESPSSASIIPIASRNLKET